MRNHVAFNGLVEHKLAPIRVLLIDFLKRAKEREEWLNRKKMRATKDKNDLVHEHGVKRKSIFFHLPYWQVDQESYPLNPM
jgi:hypothetical protein